MNLSFSSLFQELKAASVQFDAAAVLRQKALLRQLSARELPRPEPLIRYYNLLLFMKGHPADAVVLKMAEREEKRITVLLRKNKPAHLSYKNSGLPYVLTEAAFSCDLLQWLRHQQGLRMETGPVNKPGISLNEVLSLTLPSVERDQAFAGYEGMEILDALGVPEKNRLSFLLMELEKLNDKPFARDLLWEKLDMQNRLFPEVASFSRGQNRFSVSPVFVHSELMKRFDHNLLLNQNVPAHTHLSEKQDGVLAGTIKTSLALMARETDPVTYMDERSLRLYELERGISIAIFGMIPERQLPFESYVGYTLFKNGYPAAYGGAWVFGRRALFGINIFEAFRGGESGYMLIQLLRLYRQVFRVDYFEVEPYQYGKDNPEGIDSGAFWFYYRYGFRPLDHVLRQLASSEMKKISSRKDYRSSRKALERFTAGNIALNLGGRIPISTPEWTHRITRMISIKYGSGRQQAERDCIRNFCEQVSRSLPTEPAALPALTEAALLAGALKIKHEDHLQLLAAMAAAKPNDLYRYQEVLLDFLKQISR